MSRIKEYYHDQICEGLEKLSNDREGIAPRRETSTHLSLRKEITSTLIDESSVGIRVNSTTRKPVTPKHPK